MTNPAESKTKTAYIQFKLANIWQAKGQVARAMAGYQEIMQTYPDYLPAQLELGNLLSQQGRLAEAEAHYRQALILNPHEPSLRKRLADILGEQTGQEAQAADQNIAPYQHRSDKGLGHILLYTDRPGAYGAEQIGQMLMLHLVETGYTVTCAQERAQHQLIEERHRAGIQHLWLAEDDIYDPTRTPQAFSNYAEAEEIFTTARPDLIIFNDGCPLSNLAAKQVAARLNIPYIVVAHCVTAAWAAQFAPYLAKLPEIYQQAQAVVAVSQENLALLRQFFGLPAGVGQVIINGRPASYFAPPKVTTRHHLRQILQVPAEAIVIFTVGRLELVKGYQYQIKAIKQLKQRPIWPQLYFMWAGVGALEAQLKAIITQWNLEAQVKFLGECSDIPDLLDAADIFLLPSQYEGMPLSLMEAMAKGLPTMATAISGIPEALGEAGKLLPDPQLDPQATVDELVATLEQWATNPALRQAIGQAGRKRAEALFRAEKMLAHYLELIKQTEG